MSNNKRKNLFEAKNSANKKTKNTNMAKQSDDKVNTNTILDKLQAKECRTKNSNSDVLPVSKPTDKAKTPVIEKKDLELLKKFDLNMDFGPCTGITRLERFNRAMKHSLDPPSRVQELIDMYPNSKEVTHCIWHDYTL